jgi:hypothetical protein
MKEFLLGVWITLILSDVFCYWVAVELAGHRGTAWIPLSGFYELYKFVKYEEAA